MKELRVLFKYEFFNVLRGRWLLFYSLLFAVFAHALLQFGTESGKAIASLLNVVLLIVPMVSILYASVYWYSSEAFTTLLLTLPIRKGRVYLARWIAIGGALSGSFLLGMTGALAFNSAFEAASVALLVIGVVLTLVFVGLGLLVSVWMVDRMKGIGLTFLVWFYLAVVHDGLVFLLVSVLSEYPIELPSMIVAGLNPVDLGRMSLLMVMDFAALMGYTGTILQRALEGAVGRVLVAAALIAWVAGPLLLGIRRFRSRDF